MLFILSLTRLISLCSAHIFMNFPPSRHSKYSSYYTEHLLVNYNLNSPLNVAPDYFTFPCKGFGVGPPTTTIYDNTVSVTLEGSAIHGGGHCQFGISFDNVNFLVLKTVIYSCLLDSKSYSFKLPDNTPSGNLIVFWSWINKIGNREYYMECADVNVVNSNTNRNVALQGTELLVVNLPGYELVGEWYTGDPPSKTGEDLLLQRKQITLNVNEQQLSEPSTSSQSICSKSVTIKSGDTCFMFVQQYKLGNLLKLFKLNSGLNVEKCSNLKIGQQICVESTIQQPSQLQPPVSSTCSKSVTIKSGDTCYMFVQQYKLESLLKLFELNPGLNVEKCSYLKIGNQMCVERIQSQPPPLPSIKQC